MQHEHFRVVGYMAAGQQELGGWRRQDSIFLQRLFTLGCREEQAAGERAGKTHSEVTP